MRPSMARCRSRADGDDRLGAASSEWRGADLDAKAAGPPVVAPARKGFGQVVFERIGASLDGAIATEFRAEGFVCAITIGASNLLPAERFARHRVVRAPTHAIIEQTDKTLIINVLSRVEMTELASVNGGRIFFRLP